MKLALNGALTVGTLDGANVELRDAVGHENFFLFGLNVDEVRTLQRRGYDPNEFIAASPELEAAIALVDSDFFCLGDRNRFASIAAHLRGSDYYMCCADFGSYREALRSAAGLFGQPRDWARQALFNVAGASRFTSDATILGYAREIWQVTQVPVESE
jgi:starch phosphorylase